MTTRAHNMSVEEVAERVRRLSQAELRELVQQVPALQEVAVAVAKRGLEGVAEVLAVYQVDEAQEAQEVGGRRALTPAERRAMSREELAARYKNPVQWTEHPWVVRVEGYRGGRPIILGTSIMVRTIVIAWVRHGTPVWDVLDNWPVHEAQIYDALSYYYDHKDEIDEDIKLHYDVEFWMRKYPPGKAVRA